MSMESVDTTVADVYSVIENGGVALVKFDVGYALIGCTPKSISRIFALKQRPKERKCVVLGSPEIFRELSTPAYHNKVSGFSYPVGLVTRVNETSRYLEQLPEEVLYKRRVAIFVNMGELGDKIVAYGFSRGKLVFGSSGNVSNAGNHYRFEDVEDEIKAGVDFKIDLGESKYQQSRNGSKNLAATILDLENDLLLRRGLVCDEVIREAREMGLKVPNY